MKEEKSQGKKTLDSQAIKPEFDSAGNRLPASNQTFCMAPWTHTYISPQSERRLCCASREQHSFIQQYIDKDSGAANAQYSPQTLKEHWNSPFLKSVRAKMLRGEKVSECEVCDEQILNLGTYRAWFTNYLFKDKIDEAFAKTETDGTTNMEPISFDYRLNNTCNFKCRMCGHQLSSAWEAELRREKAWDPKNDIWMTTELNQQITDFQKNVVENELRDSLRAGTVEEIYWVGGEPLMWEFHWHEMKKLVDEKKAHKLYCRYNTNLSRIEWKGTNLFKDILPHVKDYIMCCSIDATGEIGEWIRTGLKWDQWLENFKAGLEIPGHRDRMKLDLTLTLPGLLNMKEYFTLSQFLDVEILSKLVYAFTPDKVISPLALPKEVLHPIVDDILALIEPKASWKQKTLVDLLKDLKTRPTFQEQWPDTYQKGFIEGRNWMHQLAKWRGDGQPGKAIRLEDIYSRNSELLRWWQQP